MNKLVSLIKYSMKNSFGQTENKNKKKFLGLYIFTGIILEMSLFFIFMSMPEQLKSFGIPSEFIFIGAFMMIIGTIFSTDIVGAPGSIFNVKDFQLLASLPISSGVVILSKVARMLMFNYLFVLAISIPVIISYFIATGFNGTLFIMLIITMIFMPLIPMSIAIFVGYIFYKISSKFKFKEIAITIIYLVGLLIFMCIIYTAQYWLPSILENAQYIVEIITKMYLPIEFYMGIVLESSWLDLLYFCGLSIIIFGVFMMVVRNTFSQMNSKFIVFGKSSETRIKDGVIQSKIKSLLKTELLKYFSKGVVVLNTMTGGVIYVVFVVLGGIGVLPLEANMIIVMSSCMFAISPTTATTISLEGKAFNMKKSLPIKSMDIIKSKVLLNIVVNMPLAILGTILDIIIGGDLLKSVTMLAGILAALSFGSIFGILVNMKFYSFNWVSETEVVKRSKSTMITTIPNLIILFVGMGTKLPGIDIGLIITVIYAVAAIVSGIILLKNGEKLYDRIGEN